jgi:hypothetical protein
MVEQRTKNIATIISAATGLVLVFFNLPVAVARWSPIFNALSPTVLSTGFKISSLQGLRFSQAGFSRQKSLNQQNQLLKSNKTLKTYPLRKTGKKNQLTPSSDALKWTMWSGEELPNFLIQKSKAAMYHSRLDARSARWR